MNDDPFTMTFAAMWALVDGSALFDDLVKPGNRVRYDHDTDRDPLKRRVADADLPELILVNDGVGECNLHSSSCTSSVARNYSWLLSTGDQRLQSRLFPVQFAIFCAMANWKSVLGGLEWQEQKFVKRCELLTATDGMSDPDRNRGIKGWSSVWTGQVHMVFKTTSLQQHLQGTSGS